jgi:glycosyltransferase involved in cell wall biosynthesis
MPRRLARHVVDRSVGLLPLFEYQLEVRRWPRAAQALAGERRAARQLRAQLRRLPTADVVTVIPTYRRPDAVVRAVESALAQTVTDHHVIVVDDGAGLPALPASPRLTAVSLPANTGNVGVVRNVGMRLTRSRLVAFLDDDNTWHPDHLERSLAAHAEGTALTYTGLARVDGDGGIVDVLDEPFYRHAMRERSFVDASSIVVRRAPGVWFSRVPRRFGDIPREDWELVWRLSRRRRVVHVPGVSAVYVVHDGSHFTDWQAPAGAPPAPTGASASPHRRSHGHSAAPTG